MDKQELKKRTKAFALRVMKMAEVLPKNPSGKVIANQIIRSATSVGANYRVACRARSKAEFVAKLGVVLEEADECAHWLELIEESGLLLKTKIDSLQREANELVSIFVVSLKTSKN